MNRLWIRLLLAGAALAIAANASFGASLPVSLDFLSGEWRTSEVRKEVAPGITFELVATRIGGPDRLMFLSSPRTDNEAGSLSAFAHRLVASFTAYQSANLKEKAATRMGYTGLDLRLELVSEKATLDCALFVFADKETWWGAIHSKPKNAVAAADTVFDLLHKAVPPADGVVAMDVMNVRDNPVSDFPISFEVKSIGDRVAKIVVTNVPADSDTERAGVKAGDAIIAIDGRKSGDFVFGVGKDSELGKIFLNRKLGDKVILEVLPSGATTSIPVTLYVRSHTSPFDRFRTDDMITIRR